MQVDFISLQGPSDRDKGAVSPAGSSWRHIATAFSDHLSQLHQKPSTPQFLLLNIIWVFVPINLGI